ncbi:MAG TPA: hypothetical protein VG795_16760 [Acidimicrobiia bacterium]|nr:hypothetical protein [Acidimicrobiia bacterium]
MATEPGLPPNLGGVLGREFFHRVDDPETPRRPRLDLVLSRLDLALEDWIDTDNPRIRSAAAAFFDAIEEGLEDKEIPPPPEPAPAAVG